MTCQKGVLIASYSKSRVANNINLKHEHMLSGWFLAPFSPLTLGFYQVQWFVHSPGCNEVNQSISQGTFKTGLILGASCLIEGALIGVLCKRVRQVNSKL